MDYIYLKVRYAYSNGTGDIMERRVFFDEESLAEDMKLSRNHYGGKKTSVRYYKCKVMAPALKGDLHPDADEVKD